MAKYKLLPAYALHTFKFAITGNSKNQILPIGITTCIIVE